MPTYTAYRDFEVKIGRQVTSSGEIRVTYTVDKGLPARTWQNTSDGNFYPEEGSDIQVEKVEYRFSFSDPAPWITDDTNLFDDLDMEWLLENAMESEE